MQREYLEWSKERDRIERERKIIAENKAWTRNKPPPPGFRKDSSGYLYRLTPEELATQRMSDRQTVKKTAQQVAMKMRSRSRTAANSSAARQSMFALARNIRPRGEAAKIDRIISSRGPVAPSGWGGGMGELKYWDLAFNSPLDNVGLVTLLNGVTQGTTVSSRVGDCYSAVSLRITGSIEPSTTAVGYGMVRLMIVWDQSPNAGATVPNITQILNTASPFSQTNLDFRRRFVVLRDMKYATGSWSTGSNGWNACTVVDEFIKLGGTRIEMTGTGGAPGNMINGSIYLLTIGDEPTATSYVWKGTTRLRFTDA